MFILILSGDEFIGSSSSNSKSSSYSCIAKWLNEMSQRISDYESDDFDQHSLSISNQQDDQTPNAKKRRSTEGISPESGATLPDVERNESGYMSETRLFENELPTAHHRSSQMLQSNETFAKNNWNVDDTVPSKSIFHQQQPTFSSSYDAYRWGFDYNAIKQIDIDNCDTISEFDMLMEKFDGIEKFNIAPDENDLTELMHDVNSFMERIPDRFWKYDYSLGLRDEIIVIVESLNGANADDWLAKEVEYRPIWMECDEVEPHEDFRKLSVRPVHKDIIRPVRPFLRKNKDDESFRDVEQYLDIQFRLLREDLVSPLRDGIALWRQNKNGYCSSDSRDVLEQLDLFVMNGVRVEGLQLKRSSGQLFRYVKFQPPLDSMDGSSQKLKFGQMVALSSDEFEVFDLFEIPYVTEEALFATVVERPDEHSVIDRIGLSFCEESEVQVSRSKIYTLVESSAYFEMYEHVLKVLKVIVSYFVFPFVLICDQIPTKTLSIFGKKYDVDKLMYKLDGDSLNINYTQRDALINALTKEFALIQGPPGTGKSFVGRLIVRILIENINLWNVTRRHPLLVVCYTNHALDHFLEGLVGDFPHYDKNVNSDYPTMVRLGTRCKNEKIEKFVKASVTQEYEKLISEIDRLKSIYRKEILQARRVMGKRAKILDDIVTRSTILFKSKSEIISYQLLSTVISNKHKGQLSRLRKTPEGMMTLDEALAKWLSIESRNPECETNSTESRSDNGNESNRNHASKGDALGSDEWDVSEDINDNASSSKTDPHETGCDNFDGFDSYDDNGGDKRCMNWKQIEQVFGWGGGRDPDQRDEEKVSRGIPRKAARSEGELRPESWEARISRNRSSSEALFSLNTDRKCEALMQAEEGTNEYYHSGVWDIVENERKTSRVPIFSASTYQDGSKKTIRYDKNIVAKLKACKEEILKATALSKEEAESIKDVNELDRNRRWMLYAYWIKQLKQWAEKGLKNLLEQYQKHMIIIGATTTGAAKNRSLLQRIGCPIVIVEEAAEVLEAHILSSIVESCKHAILIGDHQQLRPNPAVHVLAKQYKLEISMFERLIKNNYPCSTLLYQHRMAPCISDTLMPHFYPLLENADVVKEYPDVKGCATNIFMFCHRQPETPIPSLSHRNEFEGDFAFALFNYLLQQGYSPNQITILCTYAAQTGYVKSLLDKRLQLAGDYPRVDNVDAYQGEENDIVILSLVRSSPYDTIGFLANPNRICVALSRAKIGFYMIGNIDFLAYHSHLWAKIAKSLEDIDALEDAFPIICNKHGNVKVSFFF
ncbi:unnamed protein product [Anisakis simplex]|uniref:AAA domain-containing protein n=1 Tax=Anisakis simplex TaxID=6269 RepID=A0A158PNE5_ANISI|nr:unnamed protein product [Anisakis simplex]